MKSHRKVFALGVCVGLLCMASVTLAADAPATKDDQAAAKDEQVKKALARDAVCTGCHNENWREPVLTIYQTPHGNRADPRAPGCQDCHGESSAHQKDPINVRPEVVFGEPKRSTRAVFYPGGVKPDLAFEQHESQKASSADARSAACLACHDTKVSPRAYWVGSQHQTRGVSCDNCHDIHSPTQRVFNKFTQPEVCFACHKTQRAQVYRISTHPILAGKVTCSECHNPHGSTAPKLLVKNTVNETCYQCHAEKRGPFLWEHAPVVDDCTNCHTPHGSNMWALLRTRPPMLCQNCHSGDHGKNLYSGANLPTGNVTTVNGQLPVPSRAPPAQENSRGCVSCHSLIHGSNHPAGAKFQR